MAKTLTEYADWLNDRNLRWPQLPDYTPIDATPHLKPIPGIRGVLWCLYGTLLRIADGQLHLQHPQKLIMQIALEKTIDEFNLWHSMSRKPGAPWEYFFSQYQRLLEDTTLRTAAPRGNTPEVDARALWETLLDRLQRNGYQYDQSFYGDLSELAEKVAYFFHSSLQATEAVEETLGVLTQLSQQGIKQGTFGNAQSFSLLQLQRCLSAQGFDQPIGTLLNLSCCTLSFQAELRTPSPLLFERALQPFLEQDVSPEQILFIGTRIEDQIVPAKKLGMRTAFYASDPAALEYQKSDFKDPKRKPSRIITELPQLLDILF